MPASSAMAALDRKLGASDGKGLVIASALRQVAGQYDYVFLDCPPLLGVLMVNALAACEHLVIPVQTEFLAMKGLERIINTLNMIRRSRKNSFDYTTVATLYDKRTNASQNSLQHLRETYQDSLWEGVIPVDTLFREASSRGVPLSYMAPQSRGAQAYNELLEFLLHKTRADMNAVAVS
jgi:chromosome partitioning protein